MYLGGAPPGLAFDVHILNKELRFTRDIVSCKLNSSGPMVRSWCHAWEKLVGLMMLFIDTYNEFHFCNAVLYHVSTPIDPFSGGPKFNRYFAFPVINFSATLLFVPT